MKHLTVLLLLITSFFAFGQTNSERTNIDSAQICNDINNLPDSVFENKIIPADYEYSIKQALSYFPELRETQITFKKTKISTTLNARPTLGSLLFKSKNNRKYVVRINITDKDSMVTVNEVPFEAQIGLFGHEFCHFVDYQERNLFQVIGRLFAYTSARKKEAFEKEIDTKTIDRGLGWELYDWSSFVQHNSDASVQYKNFKRKIYLEPDEIKELIENQSN